MNERTNEVSVNSSHQWIWCEYVSVCGMHTENEENPHTFEKMKPSKNTFATTSAFFFGFLLSLTLLAKSMDNIKISMRMCTVQHDFLCKKFVLFLLYPRCIFGLLFVRWKKKLVTDENSCSPKTMLELVAVQTKKKSETTINKYEEKKKYKHQPTLYRNGKHCMKVTQRYFVIWPDPCMQHMQQIPFLSVSFHRQPPIPLTTKMHSEKNPTQLQIQRVKKKPTQHG